MKVIIVFCILAVIGISTADKPPKEKCPEFCTKVYAPVCGTDGKTYGNECELKWQKCKYDKDLEIDYKGECKKCGTTTKSPIPPKPKD